MKLLTSLLVVLAVLCSTASHAADSTAKELKVFIFAGQSNMEGKGDGSKLSPEEKAQLVKAAQHVRLAYNRLPIVPLNVTDAGAGNKKRFGIDFSFGPELFFGLKLAEAWPNEDILLIKRSLGATSLYGVWNPDWTAEKAAKMGEEKLMPLYADMMAYVRETLSGYDKSSYEFCGVLWVQGEADSNVSKCGPEPAATYGSNLQNLIAHLRRDTGVADLPFVMMQVGVGKVTEGMEATAKSVKNVTLVPQSLDPAAANFLPKHAVGHYNYEGQKRIGSLMADAFLRNWGKR